MSKELTSSSIDSGWSDSDTVKSESNWEVVVSIRDSRWLLSPPRSEKGLFTITGVFRPVSVSGEGPLASTSQATKSNTAVAPPGPRRHGREPEGKHTP